MAKAKDMMEENMAISYNKLWKLLIDKKMSVADMRKAADIAPNTVTRMKKDQEVTLSVLEKINLMHPVLRLRTNSP